jgi:hypothetical protein
MMSEEFDDVGEFEQAKRTARDMYAGMGLRELVENMKAVGQQKDALEKQLKVTNAHYDVLRHEKVPDQMEADGVERISYEGVGRVSLTADVLVSLKGAHKQDLFQWLGDHNFGSIVQPTVNSSTLKAFIKGRIKAGEEYPSDFLNITPITRASITKA